MSTINEQNAQSFINYTGPVPGQSLTNSPDSKQAWELPPQFVNKREAELYILEELTEKEKFIIITDLISDGMPLDTLTRTYLMAGYSKGLWDVDMMMLLIESVAYILMALAEKVGLDFELYAGENEEEAEVETEEQKKKIEQSIDIVKQGIKKIADKPLDTIKGTSRELIKKIEEIPEETIQEAKSLLAKEEPQTNNKSLLEA
jgi:hypothetical protein